MLIQLRKFRFNYLQRMMILPAAIMTFSSLAFVVKEENINNSGKQLAAAPIKTAVELQKKDSVIKPPPPPAPSKTNNKPVLRGGDEVFILVEDPPTFPGGDQALNKYLADNIRYPQTAARRNITGTVFVNFIVTLDGEITKVKTVGQPKGGGLEEEAIRVVENMPKWIPGKQNGHLVNVQFNLPIRFVVQDDGTSKKKIADDGAYLIVDRMPAYPGGISAMMKYLNSNIDYPKEAQTKGLRGTVNVIFDIDADGSISNVRTLDKIGGGLEEEAIRVVSLMPNWKPGKDKGEPVRVRYVLPVNFQLSDK